MSHQPERKEKNCLNCNTTVIGRFCHVCGQENVETRESFWSLTKHFIFDLLHFDGKFFYTLRYLFSRPGWVAQQYCLGRRMSFLHPIRMYLFTSAVFFLVFFSTRSFNIGGNDNAKLTPAARTELAQDYRERLQNHPGDTTLLKILNVLSDTTRQLTETELAAMDADRTFTVRNKKYRSPEQYDSIQKSLPQAQRDGWIERLAVKKSFAFNEKYRGRTGEGLKILVESFVHRMPYMLFLSLPFFAFILKLLYLRRKNYYYSDHAIFTIYHYVLSFLVLLAVLGLTTLLEKTGWNWLSYMVASLFIVWPLYLLLELKNFYKQRWGKTFGKFLLLNILGILVLLILFAAFLLFSIIEL